MKAASHLLLTAVFLLAGKSPVARAAAFAIEGVSPAAAVMGTPPPAMTANFTVLTAGTTEDWTASLEGAPSWASLSATGGTGPGSLNINFNAAALAAGTYSSALSLNSGGTISRQAFTLTVITPNVVKMEADYRRPVIYALHRSTTTPAPGYVIFFNTATEQVELVLPAGSNPTDMDLSHPEDRLYVSNHLAASGSIRVIDLAARREERTINAGTDVYKINIGSSVRMITEGVGPSTSGSLLNSQTGAGIATTSLREGDGEFDPAGRYYYHCDNNTGIARITRYDMQGDSFADALAGGTRAFGSRNLILSGDGSRFYWQRYAYDPQLNEMRTYSANIVATTFRGEIVFADRRAYDGPSGADLSALAGAATNMMAVSGDQQKLFRFHSPQGIFTRVLLSSIREVPAPGTVTAPPHDAVQSMPVAQLSWDAAPASPKYRVYYGTNAAAVATATISSLECAGETFDNFWPLPAGTPPPGTALHWRVDYIGIASVTAGPVRTFHVLPVTVGSLAVEARSIRGAPPFQMRLPVTGATGATWTASASGAAWLRVVTPDGSTGGMLELEITPGALAAGTYNGSLTLAAGGLSAAIPVSLILESPSYLTLLADPQRPRLYALQRPATLAGSVAVINTATSAIERVIPLSSNPDDLDLTPDNQFLYVVTRGGRKMHRVNLSDWATEERALTATVDDNHANVRYRVTAGEGTVVYWVDGAATAKLHSMDFSAGTELSPPIQPEPSYGFGDIAWTNSGTMLAAWKQFSWSSGSTSASTVLVEGADPPAIVGSPYLFISGSEKQLPVIARRDGSAVFIGKYKLAPNLNSILMEFPAEVFAVTKNSGIVFGAKEAWRELSVARVWQAPASVEARISAVAGDQSAFFYFDQTAGALVRVAMSTIGDVPGPSPEDGEVVSAMPPTLTWTPNAQALRYEVYFGTDEAGVTMAAGAGSPFYLGSASQATLPPTAPFQTGGIWWWRVDTVLSGSTVKGPVWRFSGAIKFLNTLSGATSHADYVVPPLSLDGTTMMSGYPEFTTDSTNFPGVVFVHRKRTGSEEWFLHQKISKPASAAASARFGSAVAIKGDIAWIGARLATTGGRAYEYRMDSVTGLWAATGRSITPPVPASGDQFGSTLAFDGSILAVGATGATVGNQTQAGAVDIFDAATLTRVARVTEATPSSSVKFGSIMALGNGILAVANPDRSATNGGVDIWTRAGTVWTRTATLANTTGTAVPYFGSALAISGNRLFLGSSGISGLSGQVLVYQKTAGLAWNRITQFEIAGPPRTDSHLSRLAAIDNLLAMGAPSINSTMGLTKSPVWLHRNTAGQTWLPVAPAVPDQLSTYSTFASNVAVTGRYLAVAYSGGSPPVGGVTVFLHNAAGNLPPRFTSPPALFAAEGTAYHYQLTAADENPGDPLVFTAPPGLPAWLSFSDHSDGTATLSGTPPAGSAGDITVTAVVRDAAGDTARQLFTLKIVPAAGLPVITAASGDRTSDDAKRVELSVTVAPGAAVTYQWYQNGVLLPGQTGASLIFSSVQASDAGSYRVRITRGGVWVDSDPMLLAVNQVPDRFGGDWPTLGAGPSHSGSYPATLARHKFLPAWSVADAGTNQVATGDGRVYVTGYQFPSPSATVAAYDLQTGSRLWATAIPGGYSINPPSFHRRRIYMQRGEYGGPTSADGPDLRCFDAASGASQWTARLADQANFYYAPAIDDTGIYVNGGGAGGIYGFGFDGSQTFFANLEQFSQWTPMLHNGGVYSWVSTSFRRHDPISGQVLSTITVPGGSSTGQMATVAAAEGNIAVMRSASELIAVDLTAERVIWKHSKSFTGSPAISNGIVYAIRDGGVESFDALTGAAGRVYETRTAGGQNVICVHQPVILDDTLLVSSTDTIWTFDLATGALLERLAGGGRLTYTGGVLLAAGSDSDRTLRAWKVNQPAVIIPPSETITATEDIPFSREISVADPDADALVVSYTGLPSWLTASPLQQGKVLLTGTPLNQHAGAFSFTITASDGKSFPATLVIDGSVLAVNDNPVATPLPPLNIDEDATVPLLPLASVFSDEEDGFAGLTVVISENSNPSLFTSAGISGGQLRVELARDAFGPATLKLTATDSGGLHADAVISFAVRPVNDRPVSTYQQPIRVYEDSILPALQLSDVFADVDDDFASLSIVVSKNSEPALFSTFSVTGGQLQMVLAPNANSTHVSVLLTATDPGGLSTWETLSFQVFPVNDWPTAVAPPPVSADEDSVLPPLQLDNVFSDIEDGFYGLQIVITENSNPALFSSISCGGYLWMTLAPDAFGTARIRLTAYDFDHGQVDAVVLVTINSIPDAPRPAPNPPAPVIPADGAAFPFAAASLFTDPDPGEALAYSIVSVDRPELFRTLTVDPVSGVLNVDWTPYVWGAAIITLRATGLDGLSLETAVAVSLPEPPAPEWRLEGAAIVNRQTGLVEQKVRVKNSGIRAIAGFELWLTAGSGTALYNGVAAAVLNASYPPSTWMLPYSVPLNAEEEIALVLEFYSPSRQAAFTVSGSNPLNPLDPLVSPPPAPGAPFQITKALPITGGVLIEFPSEPGAAYRIEYSSDNRSWTACPIPLKSGGTRVQWIDRGPPFTISAPQTELQRFYRVRKY